MSTKHTPGPLMRDNISVTTCAPAGEKRTTVAICSPDVSLSSMASLERMRANAMLFASASDLLELAYQYVSDLRYPPQGDSIERRIERAEKLIAKATGAA